MRLPVPWREPSDTSGSRWTSRVPVSDLGGSVLRALIVGLCALVLVTQAVAATTGERAANASSTTTKTTETRTARSLTLDKRLALKVKAVRKHRSTLRFFRTHRWLLSSTDDREVARAAVVRAKRGLRKATREVAYYQRLVRVRDERRRTRRLASAPPHVAICGVFGRYCRQALSVARCESRLSTHAQNGQYLGLFQMGSSERRLFGHGDTAHAQALAAHRYFVRSGRDWSPWSCRWAAS